MSVSTGLDKLQFTLQGNTPSVFLHLGPQFMTYLVAFGPQEKQDGQQSA